MAHKKGVGSTDNGRDSNPKYLGVKLFGSQYAKAGNIIIRQRGTKYHPGDNVYMGRDHTLHAKIEGHVSFKKKAKGRTYVSIIPLDGAGGAAVSSAKARQAEAKPKKAAPAKSTAPAASNGGAGASASNAGAGNDSGAADPKVTIHRMTMEEYEAKKAKEAAAAATATGTGAAAAGGSDKKDTNAKDANAKPDKLNKIEGIGPKIAEHLNAGGIMTFTQLASAPISKLKDILEKAGPRFKMHSPDTWPQQAKLAADGKWDELEKLQDELDGGRVVGNSEEE